MRNRHWKAMAAICGALLIAAGGTGAAATPVRPKTEWPALPVFPIAERTVVLDPGHNGGTAGHLDEINAQVPDGRGGMKACNTTGTNANDGYSEHEFTFDVALRMRDLLSARGIHVVMSRDNDNGFGPCVDERGTLGQRVGAAAVVSIHADGAPAGAHGFHVAYSSPAVNDSQGEPSNRLATTLRDGLVGAGFTTSTYIGSNGMNPRADLAGLNLAERPAALVECGNMRDPDDAAMLESPDGRARLATALTNAVLAYLG
ncbi:N-acetylmuramoyl-L-alanine amidase [Nocardia sp. NBC_01503]|uniref:N-acetylmuramoyl-L-alanine amidase n=1 Tax=Nocardia sp. NBC_01503 TaxID=2975997 RepID=UPI002E7AE4D7|nr:N-acetylmuramoyl-L-alanine amidase [Nocardia sp. NBC_01503]WTL29459.1 N-acetylmuramoyl-L-alanine amidase [Nocardia sp. NBC_01503]